MISLFAAAALLFVQDAPDTPPRGQPSQTLFAAARDELDGALLDYPSARFREVRADSFRVCGLVNSKNPYGAFVGWRPFGVLVAGEEPILYVDDTHMLEVFCTPSLMATAPDYSGEVTYRP